LSRTLHPLYGIPDLRRALILSVIVGSWLVVLNQGSAILGGTFDLVLGYRVLLDYCTPFAVSSVTSLMRNRSDRIAHEASLRSPPDGSKSETA